MQCLRQITIEKVGTLFVGGPLMPVLNLQTSGFLGRLCLYNEFNILQSLAFNCLLFSKWACVFNFIDLPAVDSRRDKTAKMQINFTSLYEENTCQIDVIRHLGTQNVTYSYGGDEGR